MYCIMIPVYKNKLTEPEILALKQCYKILGRYPIILVTYNDLDCTVYNNICAELGIKINYEYFEKKYFADVLGYNALLLSKEFYARFINYEYMLIYQLDAYVFRDELEDWCKKEYDYIGAPWIGPNNKSKFANLPAVGNGGFSLRNIKRSIELHNTRLSILKFMHLFQSHYNSFSKKSSKNVFKLFLRFFLRLILGILRFIFQYDNVRTKNNEDMAWACIFEKKGKFPTVDEAVKFSFETFPEHLYELNNSQLPFGCHAWASNYFFYKNYIPS